MKITKNDVLFSVAVITAIWFALTGIVWVYWLAVVAAYPFGLLSFVLWLMIRSEGRKRTKLIPIVLAIGLFCSLTVLGILLMRG